MFCDVAGSTVLSQQLDPEDLGVVIQRYRQACARIIRRCGGSIGRFLGDGILAYFGYPQAHEDNAARACRAALAIIQAMRGLDGIPLPVRLGCATGLVLIGDVEGEANAILGAAPNFAAKLQEAAEPGTLLIDAETHALIGDVFDTMELGGVLAKGLAAPVRAWRVLKEKSFESRYAARGQPGLLGLLGREQELAGLRQSWRQAQSHGAGLVLVVGEPGIGKSRLAHVLRAELELEGAASILYQCSAISTSTPLAPVFAELEYSARIASEDPAEERRRKLLDLPDGASIAQPVLEVLEPEGSADVEPAQRKAGLLDALTGRLLRMAAARPLLVVLEDVHWVDPTTRDFVVGLLQRGNRAQMLVLATARPGSDLAWARPLHPVTITVPPLPAEDCHRIVSAIAGDRELPPSVAEAIVVRSEGVPLYVEEMARSVVTLAERNSLDKGSAPEPSAVPNTIRDSLAARLDMLSAGSDLAQIAAVLGRTFTADLLADVAGATEHAITATLASLVAENLIEATEVDAGCFTYAFKHALLQDAAYESLLRSRRRELHGRVADVLSARRAAQVDRTPELLAQHLTIAERFEEAAQQWYRAAVRATERSSSHEASVHFEAALAALGQFPRHRRNRALELDALLGLAGALRATRGYAAPEVEEACSLALTGAREIDSIAHELQALNGLYSCHLVRSSYVSAGQTAKDLLETALRVEHADYVMIGHRALGAVSFHLGDLPAARRNLERALELYDRSRHVAFAVSYGSDHAATCAFFLAKTRWVAGDREGAHALQTWAIEHAQSIGHAHSVAQAFAYRSFLSCLAGDAAATQADADVAMEVALKHRLKLMEAFARCNLALARALVAPSEPILGNLRSSLNALHAIAPNALQPFYLAVEAEARLGLRRPDEAQDCLARAEAIMSQTGERWPAAEIARVKAKWLLANGRAHDATSLLQDALALAEAQGAGSWVARVRNDLAALAAAPARHPRLA